MGFGVTMARTGATPERLALAARVAELRAQGLMHREVAVKLGISRSYASDLALDPDGAVGRARKDSYGGVCGSCGGATTGSDGPASAPTICASCRSEDQHDRRYWTRETIVAAFREFRQRTGRTITTTDVMVRSGAPKIASKLSAARLAEIEAIPADLRLPHPWTVKHELGSWNNALRAAGMALNPSGGPTHRERGRRNAMRQYVVLSKNGHGWIPADAVEAMNEAHAIEKVAESEGSYIAVPVQHWHEHTVAPKTVFAVVDTAA